MEAGSAMRNTVMRVIGQFTAQIVVVLMGMGYSCLAVAQASSWSVHPALEDRWMFQLGAFFPKVDTTARLNGTGGVIGTEVSFEDDLGLSDRKSMGSFLASVRLGERWRIEGEYYSLSRGGTRTISRTINWGDQSFAANTTIGSTFDTDIYRLSGGYSFVKDKQKEFGVSLGLHVTDIAASLVGAGGLVGQAADTLAPLPTIGVYGAYAFSPRWVLSGRIDYFSLKYDEYDGKLINLTAGIEYRVARNFGIGAGWRYVDYEVNVTKARFNGGVDYKFSGPTLYATASF
jgi:hypothetical protein